MKITRTLLRRIIAEEFEKASPTRREDPTMRLLRQAIREEIAGPAAKNQAVIQEFSMDTVKGAFTGANKLVDRLVQAIDKDFSTKNAMYDDYLVQRNRPESAMRSHMVTFRKKFDKLFSDAGVSEKQRPEVEKLLVPKLVELMKDMDQTRISRS
jgi:hypothetical protein